MKILLYIGHHKVGSTALQTYLARNWATLARTGILYPSVEARGISHNMRLARGQQPSSTIPAYLSEPHNALAYRMIADVSNRQIPKQFAGLPSTDCLFRCIQEQCQVLMPHTVILCAEAFANFGELQPSLVTRLCRAFPQADFTVYCALRRPDDYLASWHGQRLKAGEQPYPIRTHGLKQYWGTIHFDYRAVVKPWLRRVPNPKLILRSYEQIVQQGGSVEDFFLQCALELPTYLETSGRANVSLARCTFPVMEQANRTLEKQHRLQLVQYLQKHAQTLCSVPNTQIDVFTPEQRQKLFRKFRRVESYLRSLTGQPAFFADLEKVTEPKPIEDRTAARQLLDALDPDDIPFPEPRAFLQDLKATF